jgi:hypothetical protein
MTLFLLPLALPSTGVSAGVGLQAMDIAAIRDGAPPGAMADG